MNTAGDKTASWKEIGCASLPVEALAGLADLRGRADIRVAIAGDRAWVFWNAASGLLPELLARRIFAVDGALFFTERGGQWYRLGERLPAFGVPFCDGTTCMSLDRIVIPNRLSVLRPRERVSEPVCLRLVRDTGEAVKPSTALVCPFAVLASWTERATSAQLASVQGALVPAADGELGSVSVMVLGPPGALPLLRGSVRYWGTGLLLPLGFRADPDLPEEAIRSVAGAGPNDLGVLDEDGLELISRELFKPLKRAAVRLVARDLSVAVPRGGRHV